MSELHTGLLGLGALGIIGVLAYNKWQEIRQRKMAEQVLRTSHPDVLFDEPAEQGIPPTEKNEEIQNDYGNTGVRQEVQSHSDSVVERIEPVLLPDSPTENHEPDEESGPESPISSQTAAPAFEAEMIPEDNNARSSHVPADDSNQPIPEIECVSPKLLSPEVDFIAAIDTVEPTPSERILDVKREIGPRVSKPLRCVGYNTESGEWEPVSGKRSAEYRHIRIGLQLVNRRGPVEEGDLAVFAVAMQDLADQLMGMLDLPQRQQALDAAKRLDQFCAGVDIQIGINVVSNGQAFAGTKLRALAEAAGMTMDAAQRCFVRRDEDGNVQYMLLNQDPAGFSLETMKTASTHGVTLLLDVPLVAHGERVFNQMVDLARRFADVLHGTLVDDNRRPLSENALEPIRKQIGQYQTLMASQHLPAGGPLTQRLFS